MFVKKAAAARIIRLAKNLIYLDFATMVESLFNVINGYKTKKCPTISIIYFELIN